jgi:FkbM family methyltransferase
MVNRGRVVTIKGYSHLDKCRWLIDEKYGMAYYKGYYEPQLCQFILRNLHDESVFVDVGSHAGYFGLFAACLVKGGTVYSYEPEPYNFNFIKKIKEINSFKNWVLINKAVANKVGTINFNTNLGSSSTGKIDELGGLEVEVTSLDVELREVSRLDIIKIDVEGFGGQVIIGAANIIRKFKPRLMIEIHRGTEELEIVLSQLGGLYLFYDLDTGVQVCDSKSSPSFIIGEPVK